MKTMEDLENELQTWTPRSPSARLRAGIFCRPAVEPRWGWNQARLAFASAVGLAMVIAIRQNSAVVPAMGDSSRALAAAALSNQDLVAYVCRPLNQEWNLPASGFACTNLREAVVWTSYRTRSTSLQ